MRQFSKKILAVLMTFVVLFSTMSFTINEYYCNNNLVGSAIFSEVEFCGADMQMPVPKNDEDCNVQQNNCCSVVVKFVEGQNELNSNFSKLDYQQQLFITSFIYTYINLFEGIDTNIIPFKNYSPPLVDKDINVLYQTFLI